MSGASNIASIIDYSAALAAGISGIKAVFGSGQGATDDPLRPGSKVMGAPSNPTEPYTHWSTEPSAPPVEWVSQEGTVELTWLIPMRLWLPAGDLALARKMALPFYDGYLRAFITDRRLGDLVLRSQVARFAVGGDPDWSWLDIGLTAVERVTYT